MTAVGRAPRELAAMSPISAAILRAAGLEKLDSLRGTAWAVCGGMYKWAPSGGSCRCSRLTAPALDDQLQQAMGWGKGSPQMFSRIPSPGGMRAIFAVRPDQALVAVVPGRQLVTKKLLREKPVDPHLAVIT